MPEEIFNHKGAIAVIPPQSLLAGEIHQLEKKIARTRKKETKDGLIVQKHILEHKLETLLKSLGR